MDSHKKKSVCYQSVKKRLKPQSFVPSHYEDFLPSSTLPLMPGPAFPRSKTANVLQNNGIDLGVIGLRHLWDVFGHSICMQLNDLLTV